jgi:NhaP-type Na+/H+ or K+/H+ antiporter
MSEEQKEQSDWKPRVLLISGLVGLLLGLLAGFLFIRMAEEGGGAKKVSTGNVIKLAVATAGVVRQAAQLAG